MSKLLDYISVFRPSHWFKNIFMVVGSFTAFLLFKVSFTRENIIYIIVAFICTSLAASSNYGINEVVDAEFDRYHPAKNKRPLASGRISKKTVIIGSCILAAVTLTISFFYLPLGSFLAILSLLFMGIIYNVRPFRTKELPYLDVATESINNPIRFAIGWYAMRTPFIIPVSFIFLFWGFGGFLMSSKRLAEYRFINNKKIAAKYRKSFGHYTQDKLITSIIGYISLSSFALAIICIKHSISLVLMVPVFIASFIWYFILTLKQDSPTKEPEKLLRYGWFYFFTLLVIVFLIVGIIVNPYLEFLLE